VTALCLIVLCCDREGRERRGAAYAKRLPQPSSVNSIFTISEEIEYFGNWKCVCG
jgi:hypothetical protein